MYVNTVQSNYYHAQDTQKTSKAETTDFVSHLQNLTAPSATGTDKIEEYTKYLEAKYGKGKITIKSVGKDYESLMRAGKSMSGGDVVIAPNIFVEMANSPKKAADIEQKIDYFFNKIPEYTAWAASRGLTFQSGGVVVHEDGSVTHICGGGDTPERVAEVNAINKAKREKEAARRKELLELSQEAAEQRKQEMDNYYEKVSLSKFHFNTLEFMNLGASMQQLRQMPQNTNIYFMNKV